MKANCRPRWTSEQVIQNLIDAHEGFAIWHCKNPDADQNSREIFKDDYRTYERAVVRAIRAGLVNHPLVRDWIAARRSVGDYDALRRLRRGFEAGMSPEIDAADCWIALEAHDLIERGLSVEGVRRKLVVKAARAPKEIKQVVLRRIRSKQNLHRRLAELGIRTGP